MTRPETEKLLGADHDRICAKFHRRPDGTVITKPCPFVFRSIVAAGLRGAVGTVALLGLCLSAFGQGSSAEIRIEEDPTQNDLSAIAGSVVDPADNMIVGAQISVRSQGQGGVAVLGETDDRGKFQLTLDPGKYALTAQSYGFNDFSRPFALKPNQKVTIKITLEIGNVVGSVVIDPKDE